LTLDFLTPAIGADMAAVDRVLRASLASDVLLIRQVAEYIIGGGGKRLRPALLLLCAKATGYSGTHHHTLAAVIEMIHTATLLHDDVVDESALRRGTQRRMRSSAMRFGARRRLPLFARLPDDGRRGPHARPRDPAETTNAIAEGEVLQLMNAGDADLDEAAYLNVIQRKTARLFEAAARIGGVLGNAPPDIEDALARYGMHLGTAFQLVDDVLDYSGNADAIGKNVGDDLAEGKMTLPLIHALANGRRKKPR
jgi:octaprenyl-diphosphate synthase